MNQPRVDEIRVEGHLTDRWSDWFEGPAIHNDSSGETTLSGPLVDQAALFGVLTKIHALNLTLISIKVRGSFTFFIVMLNALCKRH